MAGRIHLNSREGRKFGPKRKKVTGTLGKKADLFPDLCEAHGLPRPEAEYKFCDSRRWKFDYAWQATVFYPVALEVEGGVYRGGRHTSIRGFKSDMEKYNHAAKDGWRVFRCLPEDIESGKILTLLKEILLTP
jgi:hypothetical protein